MEKVGFYRNRFRTHDFLLAKQTRYHCVIPPMFFLTTLEQNIYLAPIYLKKNYKKYCFSSLIATVEGNKIGPFGTVVLVVEFSKNFKKGKFLPGSSSALFCLKYRAITFKVFKGEILDTIVTNVTKLGFFCETGIIQIFVAKQFIPESFKYETNLNSWKCIKSNKKIFSDLLIRIRIIGLREDQESSQAIGSIKESILGPL